MLVNIIPTVVVRLHMLVNIIPTLITGLQVVLKKFPTVITHLQMVLSRDVEAVIFQTLPLPLTKNEKNDR